MSDSDSDSDCNRRSSEDEQRMDVAFLDHNFAILNPQTSDDVFDHWDHISVENKKKAGHLMKICAFWLPILLQQQESSTVTCWAAQVGLVEPNKDLNLKHICKIEILEAILRALENGTLKKNQTKHVLWISNRFYLHSPEVLEEALHWLERTGEPHIRQRVLEFGHLDVCFKALHLIFVEFAQYVQAMAISFDKTMNALKAQPLDALIKRSEEMKRKGNEHFQKQLYEDAVKFYSKAIKYYPDNYIIYGNRALCYIKCKNYLKAMGDGKRATLIKPLWAKGHYRYCEALFRLGEVRKALEANSSAQSLCKDDSDGIRDLLQQHHRFTTQVTKDVSQMNTQSQRPSHMKEASSLESQPQKKVAPVKNSKGPEVKARTQPGNNNSSTSSAQNLTKETKPSKSGQQFQPRKAESNSTIKKKSNESVQGVDKSKKLVNNDAYDSKELRSVIRDAHTALDDLRSRNAQQAFSRALAMLGSTTTKMPDISTIDILLLHYGRATALTEIGRSEELCEAVQILEKIQTFEERTFQCLVCLAYGRVYVKENRYKAALKHFLDSLQMVKNQITPGKLTWPLTTQIVRETQQEYLTDILEKLIEVCKFPPLPDAICCLEKCIGSVKREIYFSDPDFKGFIRMHCCQSCSVEYHINCWKNLKTLSSFEKNEKDFLQDKCLTPDCMGQINSIKIFGPTGLVKCKFEVSIPRPPKLPKKPKVNQKCTSVKKLKSKEDHRFRRKQNKLLIENSPADTTEPVLQTEDSAQTPATARLNFRDHVLLQISQRLELLHQEKTVCASALNHCFRPWLELDISRGHSLAKRMFKCLEEPMDTLGPATDLLLERRSRVWARLFIHVLGTSQDIQPKLSSWAQQLDTAGLSAAKFFIERYSEELEQLDLSLLMNFSPLQDIILDKLDNKPEFFSSLGLTVTEYLQQSPSHDIRLFIWALEEYREHYVSAHSILDQYFDMMDGLCSVLKKSEENHSSSPSRSKNRGKKKKQQKAIMIFSGARSVSSREEWDPGLFEEDSLSLLDDPFSVPGHLREQVATFEEQYIRSRTQYKDILVSLHEPPKETLNEYFAQILEEHGPLAAEDPLLMGELKNFPPLAQQLVQAAGGLEDFLLESNRFIKLGRCIGLAQQTIGEPSQSCLDELDLIDFTTSPSVSPFYNNLTEKYPTLPNPYVYDLYTDTGLSDLSNPVDSAPPSIQTQFISRSTVGDAKEGNDLPSADVNPEEKQNHCPVQSERGSLRSVAVNTEMNPHYESRHGEISNLVKTNQYMERQMSALVMECNQQECLHKKTICELEVELQKVTSSVQVTQKELVLFQHKLEEEVKKDQLEKKEHQEQLRAVRQEVEELHQQQQRLKRSIREKNDKYKAQLTDFLELGNQSATERMSLEDEIKRCTDQVTRASRRSLTAQLSVLETGRDQSLYNLHRELNDNKAMLHRLDEVALRLSHQDLEATYKSLRVGIQEIEKKISSTQNHYEELMQQVKRGSRLSELQPLNASHTCEGASAQTSDRDGDPVAPPSHPQPPEGGATVVKKRRKLPSVFECAVERLIAIFPHLTRSELTSHIQKLRSASGSLQSLGLHELVNGVTQLILDMQEEQNLSESRAQQRGSSTPPLGNSASAWQSLQPHRNQPVHSKALNTEDPCIICHEDMCEEDMCVLECRHSFHEECIRSWLREQSTCPTCRDHTLLPEDFPELRSKRHI